MHKNAVTTRWLVHYALEARRKRRILEVNHETLCADDGCEKTIEEGTLIRCDAPGCGLTVS